MDSSWIPKCRNFRNHFIIKKTFDKETAHLVNRSPDQPTDPNLITFFQTYKTGVYVLKILDKYQKYSITECQIFSQLDHPGIAKCYGIFQDDFNIFILMEYVGQSSIFDYILGLNALP